MNIKQHFPSIEYASWKRLISWHSHKLSCQVFLGPKQLSIEKLALGFPKTCNIKKIKASHYLQENTEIEKNNWESILVIETAEII